MGDAFPEAGPERAARARGARRAVRAATDGVPENQRDVIDETPPSDESSGDEATPTGSVPDAWWREQRPPHWG